MKIKIKLLLLAYCWLLLFQPVVSLANDPPPFDAFKLDLKGIINGTNYHAYERLADDEYPLIWKEGVVREAQKANATAVASGGTPIFTDQQLAYIESKNWGAKFFRNDNYVLETVEYDVGKLILAKSKGVDALSFLYETILYRGNRLSALELLLLPKNVNQEVDELIQSATRRVSRIINRAGRDEDRAFNYFESLREKIGIDRLDLSQLNDYMILTKKRQTFYREVNQVLRRSEGFDSAYAEASMHVSDALHAYPEITAEAGAGIEESEIFRQGTTRYANIPGSASLKEGDLFIESGVTHTSINTQYPVNWSEQDSRANDMNPVFLRVRGKGGRIIGHSYEWEVNYPPGTTFLIEKKSKLTFPADSYYVHGSKNVKIYDVVALTPEEVARKVSETNSPVVRDIFTGVNKTKSKRCSIQ